MHTYQNKTLDSKIYYTQKMLFVNRCETFHVYNDSESAQKIQK